MVVGIVCYPTFGGSGVVATELGIELSKKGYEIHFITYNQPVKLELLSNKVHYHEVMVPDYPLFHYQPYELALSTKVVDMVKKHKIELLHVHYAIPHAYAAFMAKNILKSEGINIPVVTTLHGTDITLVGSHPSYKAAVEFSINKSDAVTAVSESLKNDTEELFNIDTEIVYTNMNQPLGKYAGLRCEILESINCLNGNGSSDLMEITLELGSKILIQSKIANSNQMAKDIMLDKIENKSALNKFKDIISSQGGDIDSLIEEGIKKNNTIIVRSKNSGFIESMKTDEIGWALVEIGAGRKKRNDKLDYLAGIEFINKIGDKVNKGDAIFRIFGNDTERLNNAKKILQKTYSLTKTKILKNKVIIN